MNSSAMNAGAIAILRLVGSKVTRNTAGVSGGGIFNSSGEVIQRMSQVVDNTPDNFANK